MFRSTPPVSKGGKFLKKLSVSRALRNFPGANILIVGLVEEEKKGKIRTRADPI